MVLIHGFSATGLAWEPVREELESSFDVLVVNLAGHVGGGHLPAAQWVELKGLGHVPMSDHPELVASTVADFAWRAQEAGGGQLESASRAPAPAA